MAQTSIFDDPRVAKTDIQVRESSEIENDIREPVGTDEPKFTAPKAETTEPVQVAQAPSLLQSLNQQITNPQPDPQLVPEQVEQPLLDPLTKARLLGIEIPPEELERERQRKEQERLTQKRQEFEIFKQDTLVNRRDEFLGRETKDEFGLFFIEPSLDETEAENFTRRFFIQEERRRRGEPMNPTQEQIQERETASVSEGQLAAIKEGERGVELIQDPIQRQTVIDAISKAKADLVDTPGFDMSQLEQRDLQDIIRARESEVDPSTIGAALSELPVGVAETVGSAILNVPRSSFNFVKDIFSAVTSPVETLKSLGGLAAGLVQKIIPGEQNQEIYVDALVDNYQDRFGSAQAARKTFEEDPVGFLGDTALLLLGVGGGAKAAGTASRLNQLKQFGDAARKASVTIDPITGAVKATGAVKEAIRPAKTAEKLTEEAQKLTNVLLQPTAKQSEVAVGRGKAFTPEVEEVTKIIEEAENFDDLADLIDTKTSELVQRRNEILATDNFALTDDYITRAEDFLEEKIRKGEFTDADADAFQKVIDEERAFFSTGEQQRSLLREQSNLAKRYDKLSAEGKLNTPEAREITARDSEVRRLLGEIEEVPKTRVEGQARKQVLQEKEAPFLAKQEKGNLTGNEPIKQRALNELRKNLKEQIEVSPDSEVAQINRQVGGLIGGKKLAARQAGLAKKTGKPSKLKQIQEFIGGFFAGNLGVNASQQIARSAQNRAETISSVTKRIEKLRNKSKKTLAEKKELNSLEKAQGILESLRILPDETVPINGAADASVTRMTNKYMPQITRQIEKLKQEAEGLKGAEKKAVIELSDNLTNALETIRAINSADLEE